MKQTLPESDSSLDLTASDIERVEHFRLRKVITVEDLLGALGYTGAARPRKPTAASPRYLGRSWGYRAATGKRAGGSCRRSLRWLG